ncbi:MAG: Na(+)-translocating NADH-quinone reductase subunit A [Verrucomicrobia bacterium]|nr:Na(+)-translocating NADH-quinone reductase subunit A [Verrucomicrobiota bacterium]
MATYSIRKGFDIGLAGKPGREVIDTARSPQVVLRPTEFGEIKQRLLVNEGDRVKRGTALIEDKKNPSFKLRAPAGGTIQSIHRGDRRLVDQITIDIDREEPVESFRKFSRDELATLKRREILEHLTDTGYLALIRQRPFGHMANAAKKPKAIFVNAMNTGPHQVDAGVVVKADTAAFQAGLDLLKPLTPGDVHLCIAPEAPAELAGAKNAQIHTFTGPHPAGNSSVHISRIAPMSKTDFIWTVKAIDLVQIGRLFLDGELPATRIVALGGNGVKAEARKHYRVRVGAPYGTILKDHLESGEMRVISGDVLSGTTTKPDGAFGLLDSALTVIPEGRERHMLGWLSPGARLLSFTPAFLSTWIARGRDWALNTNRNGGHRAMVLTGHYDKVMPMDIMVDYLVRAVLANDTEEAIKLGILETLPEDFALCDFVCPCKMEIQQIIRDGLAMIEEEGL